MSESGNELISPRRIVDAGRLRQNLHRKYLPATLTAQFSNVPLRRERDTVRHSRLSAWISFREREARGLFPLDNTGCKRAAAELRDDVTLRNRRWNFSRHPSEAQGQPERRGTLASPADTDRAL